MFSFEHPLYLYILALLPVLAGIFLYSEWKKRSTAKKIGDPRLIKLLTAGFSKFQYRLKFIMLCIAFIAGTVAVANFRSRDSGAPATKNGIDIMLALDVSNSMLATDISPSRLERSKQLLGKIMDRLENDRVGIVVFAGKAYLQMPLTADHSAAKMYLSSASPDMVPTQGTMIGDALKMCNLSFNEKETKYKAVILVSDGEDHDENAVDQAESMAKAGVVIQTIGIGSPQGTVIPDKATGMNKVDQQGNIVYSRLNEAALARIAEKGNGAYHLYTSTDAVVSEVMKEISNMDRRLVADDSLYNYSSYFQIFLMLMLFLLVAEQLTSETVKQRIMKPKTILATAFTFLFFTGFAQSPEELIRQGNTAYKRGDYARAVELYNRATPDKEVAVTAAYNLGNALYKNNKPDDAVNIYDRVLKASSNKMEQSAVHYNKGVVFQNNKKLDECIEAYKNALRINPNDEDARQNLQKALRQKKQQDQQNKNNQDQKNKDQQKSQSRLSNKEAEQKLQALQQQEKNLHDKLKKANASPVNNPEKDW